MSTFDLYTDLLKLGVPGDDNRVGGLGVSEKAMCLVFLMGVVYMFLIIILMYILYYLIYELPVVNCLIEFSILLSL